MKLLKMLNTFRMICLKIRLNREPMSLSLSLYSVAIKEKVLFEQQI